MTINYEFTPEEIASFEANEFVPPEPQTKAIVTRLDSPGDAELPVLFQAEIFDAEAYDTSTENNWANLDFGLDFLEDQIVENFRQRGKVTAAKARNAFSNALVENSLVTKPEKPQDQQPE